MYTTYKALHMQPKPKQSKKEKKRRQMEINEKASPFIILKHTARSSSCKHDSSETVENFDFFSFFSLKSFLLQPFFTSYVVGSYFLQLRFVLLPLGNT